MNVNKCVRPGEKMKNSCVERIVCELCVGVCVCVYPLGYVGWLEPVIFFFFFRGFRRINITSYNTLAQIHGGGMEISDLVVSQSIAG